MGYILDGMAAAQSERSRLLHNRRQFAPWAVLLCLAGCKLYDGELVPDSRTLANRDGSSSEAGVYDDAGNLRDSGTHPLSGCALGACWWSHEVDGCETAGLPTLDERPAPAPAPATANEETSDVGEIYLGWTQVRLAAADIDGMASSTRESFGLDLDGVCTNASACPNASSSTDHMAVGCRSRAQQIPYDGELCRDNSFANVVAIAASVPLLSTKFGFNEELINCGLWHGSYNIIVRITGYNGQADDPHVRVDWYTSTGIERSPAWMCPATDYHQLYPVWRASSTWGIDPSDLTLPISEPGRLPSSRVADPDAYVKEGYLVSHLPDGAKLRLAGDGVQYRAFALTAHSGLWLGHLAKAQDNTWHIQDGMAAGRSRVEEVMTSFRQIGFCKGVGLDTFYDSILTYVQQNADVLASGATDSTLFCDAMSFGVAFEAAQITPGASAMVPPTIECCAPGMSAEQCNASCGDGKRSGDELCDTAIPAGKKDACPTSCPAANGCEREVRVGTDCAAHCELTKITALVRGDGCCPPGADSTKDGDCKAAAQCGNNVLEAGETCDPATGCMPCRSDNACLSASPTGSAATCDSECTLTPVSACRNGDGCCPAGCMSMNDNDCKGTCGNGRLDMGETCETSSIPSCPSACDDNDACTRDYLTGSSANCNVVCTHQRIAKLQDGDSCCPTGANANTDNDCKPQCGNGSIETGEQCDDGGRRDGDGCSATCVVETPTEMCVREVGTQDACTDCVCTLCQTEASKCYTAADATEVMQCDALVKCIRSTSCNGTACYCGSDLFRCSLGMGNGPCHNEVEAAAHATDVPTITLRANDGSYPLGRANALGSCAWDKCKKPCGFE